MNVYEKCLPKICTVVQYVAEATVQYILHNHMPNEAIKSNLFDFYCYTRKIIAPTQPVICGTPRCPTRWHHLHLKCILRKLFILCNFSPRVLKILTSRCSGWWESRWRESREAGVPLGPFRCPHVGVPMRESPLGSPLWMRPRLLPSLLKVI